MQKARAIAPNRAPGCDISVSLWPWTRLSVPFAGGPFPPHSFWALRSRSRVICGGARANPWPQQPAVSRQKPLRGITHSARRRQCAPGRAWYRQTAPLQLAPAWAPDRPTASHKRSFSGLGGQGIKQQPLRANNPCDQTTTGSGSSRMPNRSYTLVWMDLAKVITSPPVAPPRFTRTSACRS